MDRRVSYADIYNYITMSRVKLFLCFAGLKGAWGADGQHLAIGEGWEI
jgi:hypothetical protein